MNPTRFAVCGAIVLVFAISGCDKSGLLGVGHTGEGDGKDEAENDMGDPEGHDDPDGDGDSNGDPTDDQPKFDVAGPSEFPDWAELRPRKPENCLIPDNPACEGYPDSDDYGYAPHQTLQNYELMDCEGNPRELAEFLGRREDNGLYNKGLYIGLGAGWCGPCMSEARHFAKIAADYRNLQIEFVYVLHQSQYPGSSPTTDVCVEWRDEMIDDAYEIWIDPEDQIDELMKEAALDAIPYGFIVDANANVRVRRPPPGLTPEVLDDALNEVIEHPYGG
ncbi:MAG: hypothetical protein B7733_14655 [Myxococcales bacterium FL481]|nr:MAG: hypothetical protein B7733_14655 [Myxococcales bacterium FL481]